jgi:hypothetical protein
MAIDVNPSHRIIRTRRHLRAAPPVAPRPEAAFDRDYWVAHCEGYRVEGHEGRIGFVEEVRENPDDPSTPLLAIRAGMLGRRILVVRADDVHLIAPRSQQVWLRSPVRILHSEAA